MHYTTSGEFGIVYKGHVVNKHGDGVTDTVAIKTLKGTPITYFSKFNVYKLAIYYEVVACQVSMTAQL